MDTSHKQENQTHIIEGVKFFKHHLDKLKLDAIVTDNPITTSELSVFLILHLYSDDMGQVRSLTVNPDVSDRRKLCISNIARDHELTYETVKKAFDSLIARGYINEVFTENAMHYEIADYATCNKPSEGSSMNYFRIPKALFEEKVFGELIKKRFHKGVIFLLELSQYFTKQIGTNRKNIDDLAKVTAIRQMSYLKKALHTSAERVRIFLDIIKNVFLFKPIDMTVKKPDSSRITRTRSFMQTCISKFKMSLNKACYAVNDDLKKRKVLAAAKREIDARIKNANLPIKHRDLEDIYKSVSRIVKIGMHLNVVNKTKSMVNYCILHVGDTLESLYQNGELKNIKRIGAFVNKVFSNAWDEYQSRHITVGDRLDIRSNYMKDYGVQPSFLKQEKF
ncbi:hypothetical protein [Bacillus pumilus]|uniref:hypothetical protein n=1 Tax=Bacillus pumilus TaxID=1408 RepID=UPI0011A6FFF5|nr:hypothetical protein [Bacillus pumilus]